jgi:hypothetical protein
MAKDINLPTTPDADQAFKDYLEALQTFNKAFSSLLDQTIKTNQELIKTLELQKKVLLK